MLKKIALLTSTLMILLSGSMVAVPVIAGAAAKDDVCAGVGVVGGDCNNTTAADNTINKAIATAINILSFIVGVVAVIFIIIGGLKYITSSGDSSTATSARNTVLFAVIGLVVVAIAQIIVQFVLNRIKT
jgi:hypothetical protein